jgi:hypothetical protein
MSIESKDLFLSSEERYEIWEIKRAERPYLLMLPLRGAGSSTSHDHHNHQSDNNGNENNNNNNDDDDTFSTTIPQTPPLLDGCDIPGWRYSNGVSVSDYLQGYLNVGSGCVLTRREKQLPILSSRSVRRWKELQHKLLQQEPSPTRAAQRIPKKEALELSQYPWFEKSNVPVVLEGLTDSWQAMETCRFDRLVEMYGSCDWRFSDTHATTTTLCTYQKYVTSIEGQTDDAPLAVYDSQLQNDERTCLLQDYQVPPCFNTRDLLECLGEEVRPPYRWILIGPARSGTGLHIDPLGTHAWVTLLEGVKRWVLFPHGTDKFRIGMQDPPIPSAVWFASEWYQQSTLHVTGAIEILQHPGETVYVPAGWPHVVLNLQFSTAITQNYATEYPSWDRLHDAIKTEEPAMYEIWEKALQRTRPDLFEITKDNDAVVVVDHLVITPSHGCSEVCNHGSKVSSSSQLQKV